MTLTPRAVFVSIPSALTLAVLVTASAAFAQAVPPPTAAPQASTPPAITVLPAAAKVAFVDLQKVFRESELGKQAQTRVRVLNDKLFANLSARDKEIQGLSEKIKTQQNLIDASVLRTWSTDLARLQREAQFAQQEAQAQSDQLQQEVLAEFEKRVRPVIDQLRTEKGLHAILGIQAEAGGLTLLSNEPGLELSDELVKRLNALK
jgi:Skp family chaperone for outer membrane proteins